MNVLIVNADNGIGGAARATTRLHRGLRQAGVSSTLLVRSKVGGAPYVQGPGTFFSEAFARLRPHFVKSIQKLDKDPGEGVHSLNLLPTALGRTVKHTRADIVHLHLLSKETMSIAQIGRIRQPVVWTFHDMWAFCGTEHYPPEETAGRYTNGYTVVPPPDGHSGIDLSRWTWHRKQKHWKAEHMTVVTPSRWMADCARKSVLFRSSRIEVIPNGIDTSVFKPLDKTFARNVLNLPKDKPLILFGAMKATSDTRKGFNLLYPALQQVAIQTQTEVQPELVVFGASKPEQEYNSGMKAHYTGRINDEIGLALLYAAADVFVAPSRQDNLPNTVMESLACGTPCVAFNIGGIPDMIEHKRNGYLAQPFDVKDLAQGLTWVLEDAVRRQGLSQYARKKVENEFTIAHQVQRCTSLYEELLQKKRRGLTVSTFTEKMAAAK